LPNSDNITVIQKITYAREEIRSYATANNYDYIFFLDTDTIPCYFDTIQRLIDTQRDVVSGLYFYKNSKTTVAIDKDTNTNVTIEKCQKAVEEKLDIEVWGFGFGCLLLKKEVFNKIMFDYDLFGEDYTDDFGYCHALEERGIIRYLDPSIICKHLEDKDIQQDYLRMMFPIRKD
jgi:GT2 family glycosyltransferase